uniref:Metastriate one of each protein family n=1 Tax=Rhipicephalus zambeziensis TaxID=60191 RepID=A0A224YCT4_9ACAR
MDFHYVFFILTCTAFSSASASISSESSCDFSGVDFEGAIAKLIAKLPEYEIVGPEQYYPVFAGLEIKGFNVSGFQKLLQYGPAIPYCLNGTRRVQVDFIDAGDVLIAIPLRHCSGYQGTLSLHSRLSRFTVQFHVGHSDEDGTTTLSYPGPIVPVMTGNNIQVDVDGAGRNVNAVAGALAMVFPAETMGIWNHVFDYALSRALEEALN